jgi:predicted outer membrane repeat protein
MEENKLAGKRIRSIIIIAVAVVAIIAIVVYVASAFMGRSGQPAAINEPQQVTFDESITPTDTPMQSVANVTAPAAQAGPSVQLATGSARVGSAAELELAASDSSIGTITITDGFEIEETVIIDHNIKIATSEPQTITFSGEGDPHFEVAQGASLILGDVTLDGAGQGGGIKLMGDNTLQGGIITGATKSGIIVFPREGTSGRPEVEIYGTEITENKGGKGAGIYIEAAEVTITDATITDNQTTGDGGAIACVKGQVTIKGTTEVSGNKANGHGGGLYLDEADGVIDEAVAFIDNDARRGGGAFVAWRSMLEVKGTSRFSGNTAEIAGGGLFVDAMLEEDWDEDGPYDAFGRLEVEGPVLINGNAITGTETGVTSGGGGIYSIYLDNVSISGNKVEMRDNIANRGYTITDQADIQEHAGQVKAASFSAPFTYAYNNYDIN